MRRKIVREYVRTSWIWACLQLGLLVSSLRGFQLTGLATSSRTRDCFLISLRREKTGVFRFSLLKDWKLWGLSFFVACVSYSCNADSNSLLPGRQVLWWMEIRNSIADLEKKSPGVQWWVLEPILSFSDEGALANYSKYSLQFLFLLPKGLFCFGRFTSLVSQFCTTKALLCSSFSVLVDTIWHSPSGVGFVLLC